MRIALCLLLSLLLTPGCSTANRPASEPDLEVVQKASTVPKDQPGEAASYYALRRAGTDDPQRQLNLAFERVQVMRRYSVLDDRSLSPSTGRRLTSDATRDPLATWTFLGPGNIGGRTRVLLIDPVNTAVMVSAAVSGGVWKTVNAGASWFPTGDLLSNLMVNSLAMHPFDPQTLYAGTGEGYFREEVRGTGLPLRGDGIFVTRNGGGSWTRLAATGTDDFRWVNDLVISPNDPSRIYAATRSGVWRSRDGGESWASILASSAKGGCLDLVLKPRAATDYIFASCGTLEQATVYRNEDASANSNWETVLIEPLMGRTSLAISPSNPEVIYALSASNEPGDRNQALFALFRSDAGGAAGTWTAKLRRNTGDRLGSLILMNPLAATQSDCDPGSGDQNVNMGWYCNVIAVDPVDENRVWAAGVDLFRSDDGGSTWGLASYWWARGKPAYAHADHHGITFHPRYDGAANQTMFTASDGGVFRTDDANASVARGTDAPCSAKNSSMVFESLNHSYGATQFYHGAVSPDGRRFLAGAQDNGTVLGTTETGIDGWDEVFGGDGGYSAFDPTNPNVMYVEYQFGNLRRSTDGGKVFFVANRGLSDTFLFITPFVLDPNEPKRLWIGGSQLWKSEDRAVTWIGASRKFEAQVSALAVAPGRSDRMLVGTIAGELARSDSATSSAANTTWDVTKPRTGFVSSVTFDPTNVDIAYATYAGFGGAHVWRSTDAGVTWTAIDGTGADSIPDIPVHSLAVDPTRPARLFLGTDLGVFVSIDSGTTWQVENTGFANVLTEWITIGQGSRGPAIYAFTHGRGAWRAELVAPVRRRSTR